jgi:hypothetical protein
VQRRRVTRARVASLSRKESNTKTQVAICREGRGGRVVWWGEERKRASRIEVCRGGG